MFPWFAPWERPNGIAREIRPQPMLVDLAQRAQERLSVLLRVADQNWKPLPPAGRIGSMTVTSDTQKTLLYDSIVEVLDTDSGRVVASQRFSQNFLGFLEHDVLYSYDEDHEGNPRYIVWRLIVHSTL
ncbi:MAG: hypothetical protein ACRENP_20015 [Longimicrobiales bacterium]